MAVENIQPSTTAIKEFVSYLKDFLVSLNKIKRTQHNRKSFCVPVFPACPSLTKLHYEYDSVIYEEKYTQHSSVAWRDCNTHSDK
jgi:hypothetical protein